MRGIEAGLVLREFAVLTRGVVKTSLLMGRNGAAQPG